MGKAQKKLIKKIKNFRFSRRVTILLNALLILGILWNLGSVISHQQNFFTHDYWQRYPDLKKTFINSQYVNRDVKNFIPDEVVYAYSGGAFILGANPLNIIPATPPLGKYIVGLSIIVFNNEHDIIIIFAVLTLILLYFLGKQVLSSTFLSLIPIYSYTSGALFKNQLVYTPLFDLMQLVFLLGIFLAFNKGLLLKKGYALYFFLCCLFLGCFISIKFFASGITVLAAWYIVLLLRKEKKKIIVLSFFTPLIPVVLLTTYARVFAYGYTLRKLIGAQKWIFIYHKGQIMKPFSIWALLLFNKWYVWWGNTPVLSDSQWRILWPIITVASFATIGMYLMKFIPRVKTAEILMSWSVCYLLFFSSGQTTTRYFVILLPELYILTVFGCVSLLKKYHIFYK
jgi:hypothetical protein